MFNFLKSYSRYILFFILISLISYLSIYLIINKVTSKKTYATEINYYFENEFLNYLRDDEKFIANNLSKASFFGFIIDEGSWEYASDGITSYLKELSASLDSFELFIDIYSGQNDIDYKKTDFTNESEILSLDLNFLSNAEENKLKIYGIETYDKANSKITIHYDLSEENSIKMIVSNEKRIKELIDDKLLYIIRLQNQKNLNQIEKIDYHFKNFISLCKSVDNYMPTDNSTFNNNFKTYFHGLSEITNKCLENDLYKNDYISNYNNFIQKFDINSIVKNNKIIIKYNYMPQSLFINTFILILLASLSLSFLLTLLMYFAKINKDE